MYVSMFVLRWATFLIGWWILTGGDASSLAYGAFAAGVAAATGLWLSPLARPVLRPLQAAAFVGPFLVQALRGALDVALKALHPGKRIEPGWVTFPLSRPGGAVNAFLGGVISVLPGTLVAGPEGDRMAVHVLHMPDFDPASLRAEEGRVLAIFGEVAAKDGTAEPGATSDG